MPDFVYKGIDYFVQNLLNIRAIFSDALEGNYWWLKMLSVILSLAFLALIIYMAGKTRYLNMKIENYMDVAGKKNLSKRRSLKAWEQVKKRVSSADQQNWKLAIIEADKILNEVLKVSGYLGDNLGPKLNLLTVAQLSNLEDIKRVHKIRDRVATEPDFAMTQQEAIDILKIYKKSLVELNLLEE
ncbi:MAG: hypothetical protein PHN74_00180 [Candidatus Pacebacteria bacterium]|nr:hypothetical protein [Candidatus Paceibacterota bacterium]